MVDADCFANLDTPSNIHWAHVKHAVPSMALDEVDDSPFVDLFTSASQRERVKGYQQLVAQRNGLLSNTMACDLSQNPGARRERCGPWMPTLTRTTLAALLKEGDPKGYIYTMRELAFSLGIPWIDSIRESQYFIKDLGLKLFDGLSNIHVQGLLGNGQHLACISAFVLYILSNIIKRDLVQEFLPPLKVMRIDGPARPVHDEREKKRASASSGGGSFAFGRGPACFLENSADADVNADKE